MKQLFNNIWLKVLALLMGFLVWFHVETEKVYNYELRLPVTKVDVREDLTLASPPPDSLLIAVTARGKQLVQNAWQRSGLRLNISKLRPGHYTISLTPENVSLASPHKNIALDEIISPSQMDLDIDTRGSVRLPVAPQVIATADDGFAVMRSIEAVPDHVTLTGPRSVIRSLNSVSTVKKELTGLRNSVTLRVPVEAPNIYAMHVDPDTVMLRVDVVPVKTRVYDNLPVMVLHVPPEYAARVNPPAIQVELTGPPEEIELLNRNALTVYADYRQATLTGMAALKIDCPSSFQVKRASVDSVRIIVGRRAGTGN